MRDFEPILSTMSKKEIEMLLHVVNYEFQEREARKHQPPEPINEQDAMSTLAQQFKQFRKRKHRDFQQMKANLF